MTTTEKIEAIKAISAAVPVLGTHEQRISVIAKLGEIIASLYPQCKCKQLSNDPEFLRAKTCNTTLNVLSLPNTTPAS